MSNWTHAICVTCWAARRPGQRPYTVQGGAVDPCCWCGTPANIYAREDPATVPCHGAHVEHWEESVTPAPDEIPEGIATDWAGIVGSLALGASALLYVIRDASEWARFRAYLDKAPTPMPASEWLEPGQAQSSALTLMHLAEKGSKELDEMPGE